MALSRKFAALLLTGSLCVLFLTSSADAQRGGVRKAAAKKAQPKPDPATPALPAYTPAPLQPLPLDQVPSVAPRVEYSGGQLSIVAHNSTLSDVLKAVKQKTGAEFEIPSNASERVVADLGPGPARDVLADLLNGTHFNYVMVGSTSDPTAVQSIVLTAKTGGPDAPAPATTAANRPGAPQRFPAGAAVAQAPPADTADDAEDTDTAEDTNEPADQNQQNANQAIPGQPSPNQPTPKTPEQLLQELQRQQQQQQGQPGTQPPGILPNQPPTSAPPPNKPE